MWAVAEGDVSVAGAVETDFETRGRLLGISGVVERRGRGWVCTDSGTLRDP